MALKDDTQSQISELTASMNARIKDLQNQRRRMLPKASGDAPVVSGSSRAMSDMKTDSNKDTENERGNVRKYCVACLRCRYKIIARGEHLDETFCIAQSALFQSWLNLCIEDVKDAKYRLMKTVPAADVPNDPDLLTHKQKRVVSYKKVHDKINGKYEGVRRPRILFPPCIVGGVQKKWGEDVDRSSSEIEEAGIELSGNDNVHMSDDDD